MEQNFLGNQAENEHMNIYELERKKKIAKKENNSVEKKNLIGN